MVRSSCFSFESAHSYFKEIARKQNFKNLPLSLAKRHQFNECCNFGDPEESPSSHPLFSSERSCGVIKKLEAESCQTLRERFNAHRLLPGVKLWMFTKQAGSSCMERNTVNLLSLRLVLKEILFILCLELYQTYGYSVILYTLVWSYYGRWLQPSNLPGDRAEQWKGKCGMPIWKSGWL